MDSFFNHLEDDPVLRNYLFLSKENSNSIKLGKYKIVKSSRETYDIIFADTNKIVYKDIYLFDAAMALVENMNLKRKHYVDEIVKLEQSYCNYYNELLHLDYSIKQNSGDVAAIFENRYELAKIRLEKTAEKIRRFRILKV